VFCLVFPSYTGPDDSFHIQKLSAPAKIAANTLGHDGMGVPPMITAV
jgi:hypothetical protein